MEPHVMETVTFRLKPDCDDAQFEAAAGQMEPWLRVRPGFVARRLSCDGDGLWTEQIEWSSMSAAKAAAAEIGTAPEAAPFVTLIDGQSVVLRHSTLRVSIG